MIVRRAAPVRRQEAPAATARAARSGLPAAQQFRQLGEVRRHAPSLVLGQQLGCRAALRGLKSLDAQRKRRSQFHRSPP